MENKQLTDQLHTAIQDTYKQVGQEDRYWYAESCASITLEHMKGFAEFILTYKVTESSGWIIFEGKSQYYESTEQLIELYFNSLNK